MALRGRTERGRSGRVLGEGTAKARWFGGGEKRWRKEGKRRATHLLSCLIFFFSASVSLSFLTGAFLMGMVVG